MLKALKSVMTGTPSSQSPSNGGEQPGAKPPTPGGGAAALLHAHKKTNGSGRGVKSGTIRGVYSKTREREGTEHAPAPVAGMPNPGLFNEENTGRLVGLPFTLAAVATNYDGWRLDVQEQKELAITGSVALNEWVSVDPKWVALCLFSVSLSGVAISKAIAYQGEFRAKQIKDELERRRKALAQQSVRQEEVKHEAPPQRTNAGFVVSPPQDPPAVSS